MEKKDLTKLLDEIFIPIGFKRKGNNWVLNGKEINKNSIMATFKSIIFALDNT